MIAQLLSMVSFRRHHTTHLHDSVWERSCTSQIITFAGQHYQPRLLLQQQRCTSPRRFFDYRGTSSPALSTHATGRSISLNTQINAD